MPIDTADRIAVAILPIITRIEAEALARGRMEGAKAMQERALDAADQSIARHCNEIGLQTYFRSPSQMKLTSQGVMLNRVEALVREMRRMPRASILALDPAAIVKGLNDASD